MPLTTLAKKIAKLKLIARGTKLNGGRGCLLLKLSGVTREGFPF